MGLAIGLSKSSTCKCAPTEYVPPNWTWDDKLLSKGNPDPYNFKVLRAKDVGTLCVAEVEYPDCKNYEGKKILVIKDMAKARLLKLKTLDPHFCDKCDGVRSS